MELASVMKATKTRRLSRMEDYGFDWIPCMDWIDLATTIRPPLSIYYLLILNLDFVHLFPSPRC